MIIFHHASDLLNFSAQNGEKWQESGFVPTMGALHQGHISLIRRSKQESSITVASIFVNPTQFNDPQDYEKYPVTIEEDIRLLVEAGCDILFLPGKQEIYPDKGYAAKHYDLGSLENVLEGFYRPGHFQGVCMVVHQLLKIVQPKRIFMGEKDFQQCMVIRRLITLEQLPVTLVTCATLRETDGLAMSSRNMRLTADQRPIAAFINRELRLIINSLGTLSLRQLEARATQNLLDAGFDKVDYVCIATPATLMPLEHWETGVETVVLAAAYLGQVRLIDNIPFS